MHACNPYWISKAMAMTKEQERDLKILGNHVAQMMENFETVQVFATRKADTPDGGTISLESGRGNWYARYGQIRLWVDEQEFCEPDDDEEDK